jgi:DNA-binding NarL/FixJ family response regulator
MAGENTPPPRVTGKQFHSLSTEVKAVIADPHTLFRSLLSHWIGTERGIRLVGQASSGEKVIELVASQNAELLIMDPMMPVISGFALARQLMEDRPALRIIAVYQSNKPFFVDRLQKTGFHGCICKRGNTLANLRQAIDSVMDGNAYYCAETCRVQNALYNDPHSFARLLSDREQEILALIGDGLDNDDIGSRLGLSPATVQTHRRNLFKKLDIHDTPALMRYAYDQGFCTAACEGLTQLVQ